MSRFTHVAKIIQNFFPLICTRKKEEIQVNRIKTLQYLLVHISDAALLMLTGLILSILLANQSTVQGKRKKSLYICVNPYRPCFGQFSYILILLTIYKIIQRYRLIFPYPNNYFTVFKYHTFGMLELFVCRLYVCVCVWILMIFLKLSQCFVFTVREM